MCRVEFRSAVTHGSRSENIWLARVAILHRERFREPTDPDVLLAYCLKRAHKREFLIRKMIGLGAALLRQVAPAVVAQFLAEHGAAPSRLSRREAERGVVMGRAAARSARPADAPRARCNR